MERFKLSTAEVELVSRLIASQGVLSDIELQRLDDVLLVKYTTGKLGRFGAEEEVKRHRAVIVNGELQASAPKAADPAGTELTARVRNLDHERSDDAVEEQS